MPPDRSGDHAFKPGVHPAEALISNQFISGLLALALPLLPGPSPAEPLPTSWNPRAGALTLSACKELQRGPAGATREYRKFPAASYYQPQEGAVEEGDVPGSLLAHCSQDAGADNFVAGGWTPFRGTGAIIPILHGGARLQPLKSLELVSKPSNQLRELSLMRQALPGHCCPFFLCGPQP